MAVSLSLVTPGHGSDVVHLGDHMRRLSVTPIRQVASARRGPCLHGIGTGTIAAEVGSIGRSHGQYVVSGIAVPWDSRGPPSVQASCHGLTS